jgi:hypothetical protein
VEYGHRVQVIDLSRETEQAKRRRESYDALMGYQPVTEVERQVAEKDRRRSASQRRAQRVEEEREAVRRAELEKNVRQAAREEARQAAREAERQAERETKEQFRNTEHRGRRARTPGQPGRRSQV